MDEITKAIEKLNREISFNKVFIDALLDDYCTYINEKDGTRPFDIRARIDSLIADKLTRLNQD
jgi:hypothetical protein